MMDDDGKFTYSKIIYLTINAEGKLITIYPNPARNYFVIGTYGNVDVTNATVVMRDITGRGLISQKLNNTRQKINIASLSKGLYIVGIDTPGHTYAARVAGGVIT